jgi:hypothetical protein
MVNRLAVKFIAILFVPPQPLLPSRQRKRGSSNHRRQRLLDPRWSLSSGRPKAGLVGGDDHFGDELRWRLGRGLNGINAQAGAPMM